MEAYKKATVEALRSRLGCEAGLAAMQVWLQDRHGEMQAWLRGRFGCDSGLAERQAFWDAGLVTKLCGEASLAARQVWLRGRFGCETSLAARQTWLITVGFHGNIQLSVHSCSHTGNQRTVLDILGRSVQYFHSPLLCIIIFPPFCFTRDPFTIFLHQIHLWSQVDNRQAWLRTGVFDCM